MTRNFNSGTRDMKRAGAYFSKASSESYSSQSTLASRFNKFVEYLKDNNIKRLEQVTKQVVKCRDSTDWMSYNYLKSLYLIDGCKAEILDFLQSDQEAITA